MVIGKVFGRSLALLICAALAAPLISVRAVAGANKDNKDKVIIHIGTPAVWSLGQAHYLLAKMQRNNLRLETNMPGKDVLDPNAINATKIQILRTLLDVEAQFSEKIGAENRAELNEFKDKLRRREEAREELDRKQRELDDTNSDLKRMNERLARLKTEYTQIKTERERPKPNPDKPTENLPTPPPGDTENGLEQDIAVLEARIAAKKDEQTAQNQEVDDLKTRANSDVTKPGLSEVTLGAGGSLPEPSDFIKDRIRKVVEGMSDPRFAASIALDNFIGMQYEIIAKQLTLLRDEVGPDERIVFLELPSSIYTVACKGDEHIAQVQWEVEEYYDDPALRDPREVDAADPQDICSAAGAEKSSKFLPQQWRPLRTQTEDEENDEGRQDYIRIREAVSRVKDNKVSAYSIEKPGEIKEEDKAFFENWKDADSSSVRAVDIIPRQSALNVNDVQSTTSQTNFLGIMKLLIGVGVRVSYQRQRELYEQYLQQEVFASGFGKGRNAFGWTFGPLPGTKRITPGVRTTYAALVIPRTASLLRLKARGVGFHRKQAPDLDESAPYQVKYDEKSDHVVFKEKFTIIIPNEKTEQFKINSMHYTPAKAGEPVTVVVKGSYFSPQAGVLVDGVPLIKSLSLGNTATSEAIKDPEGVGVRGQYELVSSRELVMKFSMPNNYIGTPNITLVTPEKSSGLNFIRILINDHRPNTTLRDLVLTEPMFMPSLSIEEKLVDVKDDCKSRSPNAKPDCESDYRTALLKGNGFRRKAQIWVNGRELKVFRRFSRQQELIREYIKKPISDITLRDLRRELACEFVNEICKGERDCKNWEKRALWASRFDDLRDDYKLYEAVRGKVVDNLKASGDQRSKEEILVDFEAKYSKPSGDDEEYVEEQTTGEYFLRFKKSPEKPEKYVVRYRQNAIHSVEAKDFSQTVGSPAETAALKNYAPNHKKGKALVDVRFTASEPILTARVSPAAEGVLLGRITPEGGNSYRGLFLINYDNLGGVLAEKQNVSVTVSYDAQFKNIKTHDIALPLRPHVLKTTLNHAVTADGEGHVITLEGLNLQRITKVKVGDKEADIIGAPDQGILIIKLPKGMTIKKDVAVQIPLILETADGTKVSVIATVGKTRTKEGESDEQKDEK
jgi:flagellar motility protein MotE (MotC chaperone)